MPRSGAAMGQSDRAQLELLLGRQPNPQEVPQGSRARSCSFGACPHRGHFSVTHQPAIEFSMAGFTLKTCYQRLIVLLYLEPV